MTLDIHGLMTELSKHRPIFHSEADFQHALAWQIHMDSPNSKVRLEYPYMLGKAKGSKGAAKPMYLDIWLPDRKIAIELKYRTRKPNPNRDYLDHLEERFHLKNQGAQDIARYDFLNDVQRLEHTAKSNVAGYAVLLTNEHLYWKEPKSDETVDAAFHIHQNQKLRGRLDWGNRASDGTKRNRENTINLDDSYTMDWHEYSNIEGTEVKYGKFRYLQ